VVRRPYYSGFEQKARLALKERVKQQKAEKFFRRSAHSSENVIELVRGEKKTTSRNSFPLYAVKMIFERQHLAFGEKHSQNHGFVGMH